MPDSEKPIEKRLLWHDRPLGIALVARIFGVSRQAIYDWLALGVLKDTRVSTVVYFAMDNPDRLKKRGSGEQE